MHIPDLEDLEDIMKDPDKKAKLFLYWTRALILIPFLIIIGTVLFILIKLGIL